MLMLITPSNPYNNNNFVGGKPILKKHVPNPFYTVTDFIQELMDGHQ